MKFRPKMPSEPHAAWYPLLLAPLLIPIATTNFTGFGAEIPLTYDPLRAIKWVLAGVFLLACAAIWGYALVKRRVEMRWNWSLYWLAAAVGLIVLSTIFSIHPATAVFGSYQYRQGLLMLLTFGGFIFFTVQLVRNIDGARRIAMAVVIGALPVAVYALVQAFGFDTANWGAPDWGLARGFSTLGNPDYLGAYLIFPTTLAIGLSMDSEFERQRYFWRAAFAICATSLLLVQVRGAWLGMFASGIVLICYFRRVHVHFRRSDRIAAVLALALLLAVGLWSGHTIANRVLEVTSGGSGAGSSRIPLWQTSVQVGLEHPLLGVGPDSFRFGFYEVRQADQEDALGVLAIADDAHNAPMMIAGTLGYPAAVLLGVFVGIVFWRSFKAICGQRSDTERMIYAAWYAAIVGYAVCLMVDPSAISSNILLMLGVGVLVGARARPIGEAKRWLAVTAVGTLLLVGLVSTTTGAMTLVADFYHARTYYATGAEAIARAHKAVSFSPWTYEYRARHAELHGKLAVWEGTPEAATSAIQAYEELVDFCPAEYLTYADYVEMLFSLSQMGDEGDVRAIEVARRGLEVHPAGVVLRAEGAHACSNLGRYEEAVEFVEDYWDLDSSVVQPGVEYARALIGVGRYGEAASVLDVLIENHPGDAKIAAVLGMLAEAEDQAQ
ncbi:MAG: O-antigen ligase family protein [Coriobacteriia bacterium]|nr:O-antigen ligase family protein [Coriobacteriia bacterium]